MTNANDFLYLFVRTPYGGELSRELIRLKASTVLAWFQKGWDLAPPLEPDSGIFEHFFDAVLEHNVPRPETADELKELFEEYLHCEGELWFDGTTLSVLNDDDELQYAYYLFEPRYAEAHPEHVQFLLTDLADWPASPLQPNPAASFRPKAAIYRATVRGPGEGSVYGYFSNYYDGLSLDDDNGFQIEGIRLPELVDYLKLPQRPCDLEDWPSALVSLRSFVEDETDLPTIFSRARPHWPDGYIIKNPVAKASDKSRILYQDRHCFIYCLLTGTMFGKETYFQMFLFDDVWACAHENLAQSILFYSLGWNGLGAAMTRVAR